MSEYPVHCDECGKYLMYRHAMEEQVSILCNECFRKRNPKGFWEYDVFIKWEDIDAKQEKAE